MLNLKEEVELDYLEGKLNKAKNSNAKKNKYYYQRNRIKDLGINTPESLRGLQILLGWPTMAVDVLNERINWRGYYNPDASNVELDETTNWLNSLFRDNFFEGEQKLAHKDALITGTGFMSVAPGNPDNGEPPVLWVAENSSTITLNYDRRNREVKSAFKLINGKTRKEDQAILWTPNSTIELARGNRGWEEISRDDHEVGIVGVVPIFNNSDSRYLFGRTEISRSLRDLTDEAMRTFLNAAIGREYYARPYRYMTGVDLTDVELINEKGIKILKNSAGDIVYLPYNNSNEILPEIKELSANDPNAVMDMVKPIAQLAAREIGVPPSYMGFDSVNPTSADAINAAEAALTNRASNRIVQLKRAYKRLAMVSLAMAGKDKPADWGQIDTIFDRTETLSPSAAADRASKLNAIGLYDRALPDGTYRDLGLSEAEIVELKAYLKTKSTTNLIDRLAEEPVVEGEDLNG